MFFFHAYSVFVLVSVVTNALAFSTLSFPTRISLGSHRSFAASSLDSSIPCNDGNIEVSRTLNETDYSYRLAYKLFRPMSLSSRQAAPIVVLHGGPSVPSNYLYPLVQAVPYRSILYYDQLGCGASDQPTDMNAYSIEKSIDDLELLLAKVGVRRFHLYGQSFGGILAFEYLKRCAERQKSTIDQQGCLSVILSSTPTDVRKVEQEAARMIEQLAKPELFRETHQCRTPEMPQPLVDAYANAGTVWRGTSAIQEYVATKVSENALRMPSGLVMQGEHDFVTPACTQDWKDLFNSRSIREKVLKGCSHHGLLENGALYGDIVDSFFSEYD
jgi:proline iminopeptidase